MSATSSPLHIENQGLAPVTAANAHGTPKALFGLWMAANIEFATLTTGALATGAFGLSAKSAFLAIIIGNVIGGLVLAAFATYGVEYGVPQMIQGASWFGKLGNRLPSLLNCFGGFSWFGVNTIIGGYALAIIVHTPLIPNIIALCAVQVAIAFVGHDLIQAAEKYFFYLLVLIFAIFTAIAAIHIPSLPPAQPKLLANVGGQSGAFILTTSVILAYVLGWIPYSSDYTRYLSHLGNRGTVQKSVFQYVFWGSLVSCIWMEALGAVIGATVNLVHPSDLFTAWVPEWFKIPLIVAIIIGCTLGARGRFQTQTMAGSLDHRHYRHRYLGAGGNELHQKLRKLPVLPGLLDRALGRHRHPGPYHQTGFAPWQCQRRFRCLGDRGRRQRAVLQPIPALRPEWGDISFAVGAVVAIIAYMALTTSSPAYSTAAAE
jgi:cytosine/uracil/thiamine/allantoin permease